MDIKKMFGASVKKWRTRLNLSQGELGARAQLHRTYISDVERGARNISLENITLLATALQVPVANLFAKDLPPAVTDREGLVRGKNLEPILLVQNHREDVELTLRLFARARLTNPVQVVSDGQEALDYLFGEGKHAQQPSPAWQLVLLDWQVPKVRELSVLWHIKSDERTRNIPVVILVDIYDAHDLAECQRLGADAIINKPLNFQRFSQVTARLNLDWALLKPAKAGAIGGVPVPFQPSAG